MCLSGGGASGGSDGQLGLQGVQRPTPGATPGYTFYGDPVAGLDNPINHPKEEPAKVAEPVQTAAAATPAPAPLAPAVNAPAVNAPAIDPGVSDDAEEPAQLARFGERYYRSRMRSPGVAKFGPVGGYSGKGATLGAT